MGGVPSSRKRSQPSSESSSSIENFCETFVDVVRYRAHERPHKDVYIFLERPEAIPRHLTFSQLDQQARALAAELQSRKLNGERVVLLYFCDLDFVVGFFACLYAGAVAVPVYPPASGVHVERLNKIVEDCGAKIALTTKKMALITASLAAKSHQELNFEMLATDQVTLDKASKWRKKSSLKGSSLAFLQYTSGSTGEPKGVMVTHENLVWNSVMSREQYGVRADDVCLSWLPLYHDMGLIGSLLQSVFAGATCYLMPPQTIVRPKRWLEAITRYRPTFSGGPNFAFDLCVAKIPPEERAQLDLSSIRNWYCGAETVRAETLEKFVKAFASQGAALDQFYPSYGLAEATLSVATRRAGNPLVMESFKTLDLQNGHAKISRPNSKKATRLVSCGFPAELLSLKIIAPDSEQVLSAGQVGEICVQGRNVAAGYWNRAQLSRQTFGCTIDQKSYLRTGDLGFLDARGELFVTGRLKDLIVIRGRKYSPQDIEHTCLQVVPALNHSVAAAFSVERMQQTDLIVVIESPWNAETQDLDSYKKLCKERVLAEFGIEISAVVFVAKRQIPRTSSGKIRRNEARQMWLSGDLKNRSYRWSALERLESIRFRWFKRLETRKIQLRVLRMRWRSNLPLAKRGKFSSL
jgi:acyl-CoA synthetase (AMP-forming)/AMP-acid ligase II